MGSGHHLRDGQKETADFLFGITRKNEHVVLANCDGHSATYHFPGVERQTVRGEYLMYSKSGFDPTENILELTADLEGLLEWSGRRIIHEESRYDSASHHFLDFTASFSNEDLSDLLLFDGKDFSVFIGFSSTRGGVKLSETVLKNTAFLKIIFNEETSLEKACRALYKLQSFVSFGAGWYAQINSITLKTSAEHFVDYYARFICCKKAPTTDDFMHMSTIFSNQ